MSRHYKEERRPKDNFDKTAEIARSAYRTGEKILDLMNIETKSFVYGQSTAAPAPSPQSTIVSWSGTILGTALGHNMQQGPEDFQRIGDSIKIQHAHLRLRFQKPASFDFVNVRVIVFWDEGNQVTGISDFLDNSFINTQAAVIAFKNWDLRFDSKVLHERHFKIMGETYNTNTLYGFNTHLESFSFPVNKHTQFLGGSTTIVTGSLKVLIITDHQTNIDLTWTSQLLFTDD